MWYLVRKFEGLLLMPFYMVWYASHGIPFFTKCKRCKGRLFDSQYLRSGVCGKCQHEMALSQPGEFYQGEPEISCDFDPAEEHKTKWFKRGKMSDYQLAFEEQCQNDGVPYHIVHSAEEVEELLQELE